MKKCLLLFLLWICVCPLFSQNVYTGSLTNTDLTFNRPDEGIPPVTLSTVGTDVYYDVITLDVPTAGLITFSSFSLWDNFAILYNSDGFDPGSPLNNALVANDDLSGPNFGFTYDFTSTGTYYLVICSFKNNVTGSYVITRSATVVLPLKLLSFAAVKAGGNSIMIKWSSANESNLNSYQVQRSNDGNNFNDLKNGAITAKNSTTASSYSFIDSDPSGGINYYRLKINERSGHISYSPVAVVKNIKIGINDLHVFPNPSSDFLRIEVKSMQNKKAFISVINSVGEIVNKGQYIFNSQALLSINIKRLPAGKYFLKASIGNDEATVVFIKN